MHFADREVKPRCDQAYNIDLRLLLGHTAVHQHCYGRNSDDEQLYRGSVGTPGMLVGNWQVTWWYVTLIGTN
jgi:hypothetical protein